MMRTIIYPAQILLLALSLICVEEGVASSSLVKVEIAASGKEKLDFWTGFSLFRSPWVSSPSSTTGRDGLGPLFNARACSACHKNGMHGHLPEDGAGLVIRLGRFDNDKQVIVPLEGYGDQLQTLSIKSMVSNDEMKAEALVTLDWLAQEVRHGEKSLYLKKPVPVFDQLAFGPMSDGTRFSLRLAPPLFGLGLLEKIPEKALRAHTDEHDANNDGISGKAARVWDRASQKWEVGRFGFKAEHPSLIQQTAAAFHSDIGISSWLYPTQNCAKNQTLCKQAINGNSQEEGVELSRSKLQLTTLFTQKLKQPTPPKWKSKQKEQALKGEQVFKAIGCVSCHTQQYTIQVNTGQELTIAPYSDLLLHDMGEGLSDDKPIHNASGREWRTTPLWGIKQKLARQRVTLLHDGRASSISEAVGWHSGEAETSATHYFNLGEQERSNINIFISNL